MDITDSYDLETILRIARRSVWATITTTRNEFILIPCVFFRIYKGLGYTICTSFYICRTHGLNWCDHDAKYPSIQIESAIQFHFFSVASMYKVIFHHI